MLCLYKYPLSTVKRFKREIFLLGIFPHSLLAGILKGNVEQSRTIPERQFNPLFLGRAIIHPTKTNRF